MAEPRNMREALAAQMLEEIDSLVSRVEELASKTTNSEAQLKATTNALADAGDNFRMAVTAFTEQAKVELTEHLKRKSAEIVARTVEEQRAAMQEAAQLAFRSQVSDQASKLASSLRAATHEFKRAVWTRMVENGAVAMVAAGVTAAVVYALLR